MIVGTYRHVSRRCARCDSSGTAVVETRVRVPTGDAVQRVFSVADAGGFTVVEVENDSTLPIAVAFAGRDGVLTDRPVGAVPIEGIDLPAPRIVLPVGHRSTVRVAIAHDGSGTVGLPASLPSASQVTNGWLALTGTASRLELPATDRGEALAEAVTAERCELILGVCPSGADDPAGFVVAVGELARMGAVPLAGDHDLLVDLADAVSAFAPTTEGGSATSRWMRHDACSPRQASRGRWTMSSASVAVGSARHGRPRRPTVCGASRGSRRAWHSTARCCRTVCRRRGSAPTSRCSDVPIGPRSRVDYAVRWHGDRPAVLWEVTGEPVELTAPLIDPEWRTAELKGEALWPAPAASFS